MGNILSSEEFIDHIEKLNGSFLSDDKANINKNYKISALLDYISNEKNFNFKVNLKGNQVLKKEAESNERLLSDPNTQNLKEDKNFAFNPNNNINNNFVNFNSLIGSSNDSCSSNAYNLYSFSFNNKKTPHMNNLSSLHNDSYFSNQPSNSNEYHQGDENSVKKNLNNFEADKNILKTFTRLKEEQERILNGNIIKVAFIGRQNNNLKLLNSFFINEKNPCKIDIYSSDTNPKSFHRKKDSNFNFMSYCSNINVSNSYCFFSNTDYIDFCMNYFVSYHRKENFAKECEFKNNLFSENYENCLEINLADFSKLLKYLCENDIVIYSIDKMNENIKTEAKYLEYLIKRFPIFKYMIEKNRFFIILNKITCEKNSLYQYQNDDANVLLNKINAKFDNKLIFELDLNKTFEEKIIYFYKVLKKYDRNYLFERNFPVINSQQINPNLIWSKEHTIENQDIINCGINPSQAAPAAETQRKLEICQNAELINFDCSNVTFYNNLNFIKRRNMENGKALNLKFSNFDFNQNFFIISDMFEKILTKKYIIKNSNHVDSSNPENLRSKTFCEFYENFISNNNYLSYDLNKAIEFDKVLYDSLNNILILKFENFYQEYKYERLLNEMSKDVFIRTIYNRKSNSINCKYIPEEQQKLYLNNANNLHILNGPESKYKEIDPKLLISDELVYNENKRYYPLEPNQLAQNGLNNENTNTNNFQSEGNTIKFEKLAIHQQTKMKAENLNRTNTDNLETKNLKGILKKTFNNNTDKVYKNISNNSVEISNYLRLTDKVHKSLPSEINSRDRKISGENHNDNRISIFKEYFKQEKIDNIQNDMPSHSLFEGEIECLSKDIKNKNNFNNIFPLDHSNANKIDTRDHQLHSYFYSSDNLGLGKHFTKDKIKDRISTINRKINESFEYIKKEISESRNTFLVKFTFLNEKINNINKITAESQNLKGEKILNSKLNFLLEIFDIYGLKHYYTSMSIEMVNYYHNSLKKMFLNYIKILNHSIITISSLENNIINIHEDLKNDFEASYEIKLPNMNFPNYFSEKFQCQKFFHSLFFKIFLVKTLKYKPIFALYNVTNIIGFFFALIFLIRAVKKLFKFSPNQQKIIKFLLYSIASIFSTYVFSFLLNKYYNRKSEKKFLKLTQRIGYNVKYIINHLNNMESILEEYQTKFIGDSLNFLNKLNEKM